MPILNNKSQINAAMDMYRTVSRQGNASSSQLQTIVAAKLNSIARSQPKIKGK